MIEITADKYWEIAEIFATYVKESDMLFDDETDLAEVRNDFLSWLGHQTQEYKNLDSKIELVQTEIEKLEQHMSPTLSHYQRHEELCRELKRLGRVHLTFTPTKPEEK